MSIFQAYTDEELTELNSNFLVDSWSYSKVMQFARNEKAFEMYYLYGYKQKASASTIAGQAYHHALQIYFEDYRDGKVLSLPELEILAYNYLDSVPVNDWKIQKTTPTVESCIAKANKLVTALLFNFYTEKYKYEDYIKDILDVEVYISEFLTINGVDIPIKCNMKIDLVVETIEGKIAIIDHKSKSAYTPDDEISLIIGKQAITYIKGYETKTGIVVDEVWFAENKHSKNKDQTGQLKIFKVELHEDTKRMYEHLLYEPLRKLVTAVADPDYTYVINDSDNFSDRAEIHDFWARTMIAEVDDLNIPDTKRDLIEKRLKKIKDSSSSMVSPKVIKDFRKNASQFIQYDLSSMNLTNQQKIEHKLRSHEIMVNVAHVFDGYSSNTYLLEVSAGTKISSIQRYKLDIANALNVTNVRIPLNLMVYEDKSYVAIEVSKKRTKDLIWDKSELDGVKIPVGKDNLNNTVVWDLDNQSTPHLLVGGATGSGKSVFLDSIINYSLEAGIDEMYILDPKYEFSKYAGKNVKVINESEDIIICMEELVEKMNDKVKAKDTSKVMIIFDEFADALDQAGKKSTLDTNLKRLLQKGRSSGFRVLCATQRASVKVINGDAKVNFPVQICFRMPKEVDSKVMIDEVGAETLSGFGDGLMKSPEYLETVRFQSFFKT